MKRNLLLLLAISMIAVSTSAKVLYVKPTAESTAWAGKDAVYTTLAAAFTAAAASDEIWIAAGQYTVLATTPITKHIKIYGGFVGTESTIAERIKVDGGKLWEYQNATTFKPDAAFAATPTVFIDVKSGYEVTINGITFKGFTKNPLNIRQKTIVEECVLTENKATTGNASAIEVYPGGTILNCYFYKNEHTTNGAVIINQKNEAAVIRGCVFDSNISGLNGTLNIKNSASTDFTKLILVENITVINNKATDAGTPTVVQFQNENVRATNGIIANNTGIPLFMLGGTVTNFTIVNNTLATKTVPAVDLRNNTGNYNPQRETPLKFSNSVVWNNKFTDGTPKGIVVPAGIIANLSNNAVDVASVFPADKSTETNFTLLAAENDVVGDKDNLYARFVAPAAKIGYSDVADDVLNAWAADWTIKSGSALIDRGSNDLLSASVTKDIADNNRKQGASVDLGAYESVYSGVITAIDESNASAALIIGGNGAIEITGNGIAAVYGVAGDAIAALPINGSARVAVATGIYLVRFTDAEGAILITKIAVK